MPASNWVGVCACALVCVCVCVCVCEGMSRAGWGRDTQPWQKLMRHAMVIWLQSQPGCVRDQGGASETSVGQSGHWAAADDENDARAGFRPGNDIGEKGVPTSGGLENNLGARAPSGGPFRSTRPEFDPAKDFIQTTAGGLDKRLVSAVWVVNNSHLPFLARGSQQQQPGNRPRSIHSTSARQRVMWKMASFTSPQPEEHDQKWVSYLLAFLKTPPAHQQWCFHCYF